MPATVFGHPVQLDDRWDDGSIYTFYLRADGAPGPGGAGGAGGGPAPGVGSGAPILRGVPVVGAVEPFRSNVVFVRTPLGGRDLERLAADHRQVVAAGLPAAKLVREGRGKVAGLAALELEYAIALDAPLPALQQWHALLVRDGHAVQICATAPRDRFERERPHFRALADSWR